MLKLVNVSKIFGNGNQTVTALDDISLQLPSKGLIIICGPSGCGKSSLLNILGMIDKPTHGELYFHNHKTSNFKHQKRSTYQKNCVAFLFQHYFLLSGFTALENVMLPLLISGYQHKKAHGLAIELFKQFDLLNISEQQVTTLSGGEAQRVALMRALVKRTPIVLADEPTGALDTQNGTHVMKILVAMSQEKLVIVVTHNPLIIAHYGDRIIKLQSGRIVCDEIRHSHQSKANVKELSHKKNQSKQLLITRFLQLSKKSMSWALLSLIVSLVGTLLTLGIHHGGNILAIEQPLKAFDSSIFYLSNVERTPIKDSPLNLVSYQQPQLEDIDVIIDLDDATVDVSLRGLLATQFELRYHNQPLHQIELTPCDDYDGHLTAYNQLLINEKAAKMFKDEFPDFRLPAVVNYQTDLETSYNIEGVGIIHDRFEMALDFNVLTVVNDWLFHERPRIFFSHERMKTYLASQILVNLSRQLHQPISWYERLLIAQPSDPITNYELMVIHRSEAAIISRYMKRDDDAVLSWQSSYIQERLLIQSLVDTIGLGLVFFIVISGISALLTLALTLMHCYRIHRHRIAILWQLGLDLREIRKIFIFIGRIISLIALALSFGSALILSSIANMMIERVYYFPQLIRLPIRYYGNIPFAIPIVMFVTLICLGDIIALIATRSLKTESLISELKDHD